jgi:hypothetical protein
MSSAPYSIAASLVQGMLTMSVLQLSLCRKTARRTRQLICGVQCDMRYLLLPCTCCANAHKLQATTSAAGSIDEFDAPS